MALPLFATALFAQTPATCLSYEAATVKLNTSGDSGSDTDGTRGQIIFRNITLERLIEMSYGVGPHQVAGPEWLSTVHVDIAAKYPPDTARPERFLMLRCLLEDSFKLAVHREEEEVQGYALLVAKGGFKLKAVEGGSNDTSTSGGRVRTLAAKSTSLASLADIVARYVGAPVVDRTTIAGVFDFDLRWSNGNQSRDSPERADDTPTLPIALQETLGLKLQAQKVPVQMVIVDHMERVPVEK